MFRRPVLAIAERPEVKRIVCESALTRSLVDRFVAGEDLETAIEKVQRLARLGMTVTLDQLGENVASPEDAAEAARCSVLALRRMAEAGLEPNISVKLTKLGLDLGEEVACDHLRPILEAAREVRGFVRIDMEGSAYLERTFRIFETFHDRFPDEVGTVIQSYLYRSRADVERMLDRGARVRLVKGAYAEPASIAYQDSADVDDAFERLMKLLMEHGRYPAIATHDPRLIASARSFAAERGIAKERFEFQLLYGVRRDEQVALVGDGYRVRIYVPFGTEWYPYFSRRIAERPANALFVLRQSRDGGSGHYSQHHGQHHQLLHQQTSLSLRVFRDRHLGSMSLSSWRPSFSVGVGHSFILWPAA
jgi:proline dehydrogenase